MSASAEEGCNTTPEQLTEIPRPELVRDSHD